MAALPKGMVAAGTPLGSRPWGTMMETLRLEYSLIKRAESVLHDHQSRWMNHVEEWIGNHTPADGASDQWPLLAGLADSHPGCLPSAAEGGGRLSDLASGVPRRGGHDGSSPRPSGLGPSWSAGEEVAVAPLVPATASSFLGVHRGSPSFGKEDYDWLEHPPSEEEDVMGELDHVREFVDNNREDISNERSFPCKPTTGFFHLRSAAQQGEVLGAGPPPVDGIQGLRLCVDASPRNFGPKMETSDKDDFAEPREAACDDLRAEVGFDVEPQTEKSRFDSFFSDAESRHDQAWADMVLLLLRSARKELRQLRKAWVQSEMFISKSLKTSKDTMSRGSGLAFQDSERRSLGRRLSTAVQAARGSLTGDHSGPNVKVGLIMGIQCVMNPTSPTRLSWVILGMMLLLYELIVFPLSVFELPDDGFVGVMRWMGQIYWTLDIIVTFLTGVVLNGELVMDIGRIARTYVRTWLIFDSLVTIPVWFIMFIPGLESGAETSSLRSVRYIRMLRFLRLARMAKFEQLLGEAMEFVNSASVILCFGMCKLMIYLVILTHFNACLWYYVGNREAGWANDVTGQVAGRDDVYKYVCAIHWALTQFQGTSEILPGSTLVERIYASVFLTFALIILASFVATLTNMLLQLQALKDMRNRQHREIRSYLQANQISRALSMRVKKYVEWKLQLLARSQNDEAVLAILPPPLVSDLFYEIRGASVSVHHFFSLMEDHHPRIFRRLCHQGLNQHWQAPHELIFQPSDEADKMYFVCQGTLRYRTLVQGDRVQLPGRISSEDVLNSKKNLDDGGDVVQAGDSLCEACLWVDWLHCGALVAETDSVLLGLENKSFDKIVVSYQPAHAMAVLYARSFLAALNCFGKNYSDFVRGGMMPADKIEKAVSFHISGSEIEDDSEPEDEEDDEDLC